jgi:hypothetical protein
MHALGTFTAVPERYTQSTGRVDNANKRVFPHSVSKTTSLAPGSVIRQLGGRATATKRNSRLLFSSSFHLFFFPSNFREALERFFSVTSAQPSSMDLAETEQ